jgi:hypothetical protein
MQGYRSLIMTLASSYVAVLQGRLWGPVAATSCAGQLQGCLPGVMA